MKMDAADSADSVSFVLPKICAPSQMPVVISALYAERENPVRIA